MSKINLSRDYEKLLRNKAEKYLRDDGSRLNRMEAMSMEEIKTTFEELEVHKIELEMQNEELKAAKSELESSKQRYFDLYNFAPVGYFTIDHKGSIAGMNLTAATMLEREREILCSKKVSQSLSLWRIRTSTICFAKRYSTWEKHSLATYECSRKTARVFGLISWEN